MTDTEIIEAIIANRIWVNPSYYRHGWNAAVDGSGCMAWNRPTLRQAVEECLEMIVMKEHKV